jgi:SAM-dependent methyltransferase
LEIGQKLCSCCGYGGAFVPGPNNRPNAGCPQCASLERHRFLQLVGPSLCHYWIPETRHGRTMAIEVAPCGPTAAFRNMFDRTLTIDADPDADGRTVDMVASLVDLPVDDATADVMLILHVLEHIPDDRQAMREIARVLMPHGVAVLQVPLSGRLTTDEGEVGSVEERIARFGQADHVRFYGDDFFERLSEAGLEAIAISPRQSMAAEAIEKYGLLPDQALVFSVRADSPGASKKLKAFEKAIRKGASTWASR